MLLLPLFSLCILSPVLSYPDYIPDLACGEMFPIAHGVDAMNHKATTRSPPYLLTVNVTTYEPGDVIEIFLNASQPEDGYYAFYEGAFIEARRSDCNHPLYSEPVGTFFLRKGEDFLMTMTCSKKPAKAIRHMKHEHVYNSTFYWKAPSTSVGHIYFRATVARKQTKFWTNVNSDHIKDSNSSASLPSDYCKARTNYIGCPEPKPTGGAASFKFYNIMIFIKVVLLVHFICRKVL